MLMMKLYEKLFYNGEKISKIVMVLIPLTVIMIIRNYILSSIIHCIYYNIIAIKIISSFHS